MADLDDVRHCTTDGECAGCHTEDGLEVATMDTAVGVLCLTLCGSCLDKGQVPGLSWSEAVGRSLDHCAHLGIDADQMAKLMEASA